MDWINEQIAIGSFKDAQGALDGVDAVLCLRPGCSCEDREELDVLFVPLVDGSGNRLERVDEAVAFIDEVVSCGEHILVHCHAGRSRSVAVVARYLMKHRGLGRAAALSAIAAKREVALTAGLEKLLEVG